MNNAVTATINWGRYMFGGLMSWLLALNLLVTIGFGVAVLNAISNNNRLRARDDAWIGTRIDQLWQVVVADGLPPETVHQLNQEIVRSRQRAGLM